MYYFPIRLCLVMSPVITSVVSQTTKRLKSRLHNALWRDFLPQHLAVSTTHSLIFHSLTHTQLFHHRERERLQQSALVFSTDVTYACRLGGWGWSVLDPILAVILFIIYCYNYISIIFLLLTGFSRLLRKA